jgi:hypothetical protein
MGTIGLDPPKRESRLCALTVAFGPRAPELVGTHKPA